MADGNEVARLRGLYSELGDEELLRLAGTRDGLTEAAQQAVDAEMQERGLVVPVAEEASVAAVAEASEEDEVKWVELRAFQLPGEAEKAYRNLEEREVPVQMGYAERQLEENGPVVRTNWIALFVPEERKEDAVRVLQREMNLFPGAERHGDADEASGEEDGLFPVGTFEEAADVELAKKALSEAGIWFRVDEDGLTVEVKPEDVDAALVAVEGGFAQGDD